MAIHQRRLAYTYVHTHSTHILSFKHRTQIKSWPFTTDDYTHLHTRTAYMKQLKHLLSRYQASVPNFILPTTRLPPSWCRRVSGLKYPVMKLTMRIQTDARSCPHFRDPVTVKISVNNLSVKPEESEMSCNAGVAQCDNGARE